MLCSPQMGNIMVMATVASTLVVRQSEWTVLTTWASDIAHKSRPCLFYHLTFFLLLLLALTSGLFNLFPLLRCLSMSATDEGRSSATVPFRIRLKA